MQLTNFILTILLAASGLGMIGLILLQQGKGADAGAGFGTGSANGVFGASGSANFLSRSTAVLAAIFFAVVIALNLTSSYKSQNQSLLNQLNSVHTSAAQSMPSSIEQSMQSNSASSNQSNQKNNANSIPK